MINFISLFMRLWILILLLTGCTSNMHVNSAPTRIIKCMPYPDPKPWNVISSIAPSTVSDCGGALSPSNFSDSDPLHDRTWSIGEKLENGTYVPVLFFNTEIQAKECIGSSSLEAYVWDSETWR